MKSGKWMDRKTRLLVAYQRGGAAEVVREFPAFDRASVYWAISKYVSREMREAYKARSRAFDRAPATAFAQLDAGEQGRARPACQRCGATVFTVPVEPQNANGPRRCSQPRDCDRRVALGGVAQMRKRETVIPAPKGRPGGWTLWS